VCVILVLVTHLLFPTDPAFVSRRFIFVPWYVRMTGIQPVDNPALRAVKWLIVMLLLPMLVADAAAKSPKIVNRIATAWLLGAAVSAFIAITDLIGLTRINLYLIVLGGATSRQGGLASHPNHLGMAVAMVAPLAIGVAMRSRWKGLPLLIVLMAGAIITGSRAGQAGFVLAVAATLAFFPARQTLCAAHDRCHRHYARFDRLVQAESR
jgi:hypothetical protein